MTWAELWNNYINSEPGILTIGLRLLCAMVIGTIIGFEREFNHRPAGLRTHILVALGACVVSILGETLFTQYHALGANPDPARLSAQVITGVGFLGAGMIVYRHNGVSGLTTAAGVWTTAGVGMACGGRLYVLAIGATIISVALQCLFQ